MNKLDNWAAFGSEYLKAIDVLKDTDEYVIVSVSSKEETRNGKTEEVLHLKLERNESEKLFGCNKTNAYTIQTECPNSPKDVVGRIITFNKVDVQKPGTDEIVKGLRIQFKPKEETSPVDKNDVGIKEDNTI